MRRLSRQATFVTAALAALAGVVDALAFQSLGGFYASFMSGNTTRLGVGLAGGGTWDAWIAGALILAFVAGTMLGTVAAVAGTQRFGERHRAEAVMAVVTLLLTLGAALTSLGPLAPALLPFAAAMGALNAVVAPDGEVRVGLTYMTGTLVRIGQRLARRLMGQRGVASVRGDLLLWLGFLAGVAIGALGWSLLGFAGFWVAAALSAVLSMWVGAIE